MNVLDVFIVVIVGCVVPLLASIAGVARPLVYLRAIGVILGGTLFCALGFVLFGGSVEDLVQLRRTSGFGRGFVAGIGLLAGFTILLLVSLAKAIIRSLRFDRRR